MGLLEGKVKVNFKKEFKISEEEFLLQEYLNIV